MIWLALLLPACGGVSQNQPTYTPLPIKVILVLNGLWQNPDTFNDTIERLSTAFQKDGIQVQINKLVEVQTSKLPITDQANYAFSRIQQYYSGPGFEIILVGYSQGGLRGAQILALNQKANNPLNIKGLITLATPWEGAPAATITQEYIKKLLHKKPVKAFLKLIKRKSDIQVEDLFPCVQDQLFGDHCYPTHQPGVQDMVPQSAFLQDIKAMVGNNKTPMLVIAGKYDKVDKLLPAENEMPDSYIKRIRKLPPAMINKFYSKVFTGSSQHDMIVPVDSQLAKHFTYKHIERRLIEGAIHDELPGLIVPKGQIIYNHQETCRLIIEFAKKKFTF